MLPSLAHAGVGQSVSSSGKKHCRNSYHIRSRAVTFAITPVAWGAVTLLTPAPAVIPPSNNKFIANISSRQQHQGNSSSPTKGMPPSQILHYISVIATFSSFLKDKELNFIISSIPLHTHSTPTPAKACMDKDRRVLLWVSASLATFLVQESRHQH